MPRSDREILDDVVRVIAEQAADSDRIVDEGLEAGMPADDPIVVHTKMLRLELLNLKSDVEGELEKLVLDCSKCGQRVHYAPGLGVTPGHWAHREPAPHHAPMV